MKMFKIIITVNYVLNIFSYKKVIVLGYYYYSSVYVCVLEVKNKL